MSDFIAFYQHSYRRLVGQLSAYLGDAAEAEDVVQEAYLRAWQRWEDVSGYMEPEAWVRRVAWNLATGRWRRLAVATRYLLRQGRPESAAEITPDRVALIGALRDLPDTHRRAVVLHYLGDLPVDQIADELGVARGTVLSWLHRSRIRLADLLRDEAMRPVSAPPAAQIIVRAKRRRTTRLAAAIAALLTGATAAAAAMAPIVAHLPTPATRIEDVAWTSGTITLPGPIEDADTCPTGRREIDNGSGYAGRVPAGFGHIPQAHPAGGQPAEMWIDGGGAAYGDLTGDGVNEAVLKVYCAWGTNWMDPETSVPKEHLLVVTRRSGRLMVLGLLGPSGAQIVDFHIDSGKVVARFKAAYVWVDGDAKMVDSPTHKRSYAYNGVEMIQTAGPRRALGVPGSYLFGDTAEFAAVRVNGRTICPAETETAGSPRGAFPHRRYNPHIASHEIDLNDDGDAEVLTPFICGSINVNFNCPSLFLLQQGTDRLVTLDVPLPNDGSFTIDDDLTVIGHGFTVTVRDSITRRPKKITMTWDGTRFVRN